MSIRITRYNLGMGTELSENWQQCTIWLPKFLNPNCSAFPLNDVRMFPVHFKELFTNKKNDHVWDFLPLCHLNITILIIDASFVVKSGVDNWGSVRAWTCVTQDRKMLFLLPFSSLFTFLVFLEMVFRHKEFQLTGYDNLMDIDMQ